MRSRTSPPGPAPQPAPAGRPPAPPPPCRIAVGSPPTDDGGGSYSFDVTDAHGEQLTAAIRCELDTQTSVDATDSIRFQP